MNLLVILISHFLTCCIFPNIKAQDNFSVCSISSSYLISCNFNGTMTKTNDDYFSINVTATSASGYYIVKVGNFTSPIILSNSTFTIVGNGLNGNPSFKSDNLSIYQLIVEDAIDSSCSQLISTIPVQSCSTCYGTNAGGILIQKN